jgi:hypothetical protein
LNEKAKDVEEREILQNTYIEKTPFLYMFFFICIVFCDFEKRKKKQDRKMKE